MADKNFQVKNGLTVGTTERISSAGVFTGSLASTNTATTQSASNNSTKIATTAYVDTAVTNLVDSAPGTLNTLNELAAALGDDANYSTTITSSLATKAAIAGQAFTDTISVTGGYLHSNTVGSDKKFRWSRTGGKVWSLEHDASGFYFYNETDSDMHTRFLNNGNLGIGVNTPAYALHVEGSGSIAGLISRSGSGTNSFENAMIIDAKTGNDAADGYGPALYFTFTDSGVTRSEIANISVIRDGADNSGQMQFGVRNSGTWDYDAMVIDSTSAVGIGTSSPTSFNSRGRNLVVNSDGDTGITISANTSSSSTLLFADSYAGTGGTSAYRGIIEYDHATDHMAISTAAAERMRIDSSGKVGIGNTNPGGMHSNANQLVVGTGSGDQGMSVYAGTSVGRYAFARAVGNNTDAYDGGISYNGDRDLSFHTNAGSTRMTIDGSGNVGIGTTSPSATLHINTSTNSPMIVESTHGTGGYIELQLSDNGSGGELTGYIGSSEALISGGAAADLGIRAQGRFEVSTGGNSKRMSIFADGSGQFYGSWSLEDNKKLQLGASADLQIWHDASDSYIRDTGTGNLLIQYSDLYFSADSGSTHDVVFRSTGYVGIGNTVSSIGSSATTFLGVGDGSGSGTISIYTGSSHYGYLNFADGTSGAGADPGYMRYNHNDNTFYFNRSVSGPSFSSDISKKENIVDIANGWNVIKDLKPRIFDWKKDVEFGDYLPGMGQGAAGFIAQELEEVLPNEVHGIDGEKGISPMGIIAHLVKTVQELEGRIKTLEG